MKKKIVRKTINKIIEYLLKEEKNTKKRRKK